MSYKIQRFDFFISSDYLQEIEDFLSGKSSTLRNYKKSIDIKVPKEIEWLNGSVDYKLELFINKDSLFKTPMISIILVLSCNGECDDIHYSVSDIKDIDYIIAYGLVDEYYLLISVTREIPLNINTREELTIKLNENISKNKDYTLGVLIKNSLSNGFERIDFILASLFHLQHHKPCNEIIMDYMKEKLEIYGYDEEFYIDFQYPKKTKSSEDVFNFLLYLLLSEVYQISTKMKIKTNLYDLMAIQNSYSIHYFREEALKTLETL